MRYIILKTKEIEALELLFKTRTNKSIRKCSQCLLLSHQRLDFPPLNMLISGSIKMRCGFNKVFALRTGVLFL